MKVLLHPVVNDEPAPTPDMKLLEPVMRSLEERVTVVNPRRYYQKHHYGILLIVQLLLSH